MLIHQGNIYLESEHVNALRSEDEIVKKRYQAVARTLLHGPFRFTRQKAADFLRRSKRQLQRWVKRFREEGIEGLRNRSKKPNYSPNKVSEEIQDLVVEVRRKSGFSSQQIGVLVNEYFKRNNISDYLWPSTAYNILVRKGELSREKQRLMKYRSFEWGHPKHLLQADLTMFNGIPILTILDDYSRKGWALAIRNQKDSTVIRGMKKLIPYKYENILTDNGSQFSRKNSRFRKYCEEYVTGKHIWTSIHRPRTMGKLSAFQKAMKRFLRHQIPGSRNKIEINYWIEIFLKWYNTAKIHSAIGTYPEVRYSGKGADDWFETTIKDLKLQNVLQLESRG